MNDMYSAAAVDGRFNFRGKVQEANHSMINWELRDIQDFSLELKFMVGNVRNPADSGWSVVYVDFNEETRKLEGKLDFGFTYGLGAIVEPNVAFVEIIWSVPAQNPQIDPGALRAKFIDVARFAYEKEVWYTLKIDRDGNGYIF